MPTTLRHPAIIPARVREKSHDHSILVLVSVGLFALGLIIVLAASGFSNAIEPINPDLVIAHP
jgi:hypothetical protein